MKANEGESRMMASAQRCDTRVWSGECMHSDSADTGEKYLCEVCGQLANLDHEVRHDTFPYVSGDKDFLS